MNIHDILQSNDRDSETRSRFFPPSLIAADLRAINCQNALGSSRHVRDDEIVVVAVLSTSGLFFIFELSALKVR